MLQAALAELAAAGYGLRCGLEVEFHIYRIDRIDEQRLDPAQADWPGAPTDIVLGAGEQLAIAPGQHVVMEPWEPDAPGAEVSFRWDCVAAALAEPSRPSQRSVAARDWDSGVVQPLCDLVQAGVQGGRAVADGARAGGRVATGLVRFALGRTTAPLLRRTA